MTRRLIGYDVTGWRDTAVRNWLAQPGDGENAFGEFPISGGLGSMIQLDAVRSDHWIGGIAAQLAPHGRGGGWGHVGRPEARQAVRDLIDAPADHVETLSATLRAMGGKADVAVVAIDDAPADHDAISDGWIAAMRKAGHRRGLHVWRPILTVLSALLRGLLQDTGEVTIISQGASGLFLQTLRIRSEDAVLAPERRVQGQFFPGPSGFQHRRAQAEHYLTQNFLGEQDHAILRSALSPGRFALGFAPEPELVRTANGGWTPLPELPPMPQAACDLPPELILALGRERPVLLETVAEGPARKAFIDSVRKHCAVEPHVGKADAVAHGAFIAAERASNGVPIYYDFLPQISTIVQPRNRDPESIDLIPQGVLLPAGQIYRSTQPARFGLQDNQETISVYLRKELDQQPRKAALKLPIRGQRGMVVDLFVEQAPAEGRARLTLQSQALPAPLVVDWGRSGPTNAATWEDLLKSLERPRPTIPSRLVLPSTDTLWRGRGAQIGFSALLTAAAETPPPDWDQLAGKLDDRINGVEYCVSSDGDFPTNVSAKDRARFETLHREALNHALDRARGRIRLNDNASLKFLTWMHKRCDRRLIPEMLAAMEAAEDQEKSHPFVWHGQNAVLIYQGLGRIIRDNDTVAIDRIFQHLRKIPPTNWHARRQVACAAFLLSRTDEAPKRLSQEDVDVMATAAVASLYKSEVEVRRQRHSGLHYPPYLIAGLLRWRLASPRALVAGSDENANRMLTAIEKVLPTFQQFASTHRTVQRLHKALRDTAEFLKGEGSNTNLLTDIETTNA